MIPELLDGLVDFVVANPGSSRGAVRDELVRLQPELRNRDAAGVIDALALGLGELGYFDVPAADVTFVQLRNRLEALGALVAKRALHIVLNQIRGQPGMQIAELRVRRAPLVDGRTQLTAERDDVTTFRDAQFPTGIPPESDPVNRRVFLSITEIRRQIIRTRSEIVTQLSVIDDALASLGS